MIMAELDAQTESLVQQLYEAWSTNADPTSYLNLRDQLLSRRERVDRLRNKQSRLVRLIDLIG